MEIFLNLDFRKVTFIILKLVLIVVCVWLILYTSVYFLPFIVAFVVSILLEPLIKFLATTLKLPRKLSGFICLISIILILGKGLFWGISKILYELSNLSKNIPLYSRIITKNIERVTSSLSDFYFSLPVNVTKSLENFFWEISNTLSSYLDFIVKKIVNTAISLPNAIIVLLVTIVSTYFFISDKEKIGIILHKKLSKKTIKFIHIIKNESFLATGTYIKSQLILATISTLQVAMGFSILHIKNILTLSILLFILDLLPLIGVGSVLIPWGIYEIIFDSSYHGTGLLLLYLSILIIRNLIEPKILSSQIGVHPLIILMSMYVGFKLLGVLGLILVPLMIMLFRNIFVEIFKSYSYPDFKELLLKNVCKDSFYDTYKKNRF